MVRQALEALPASMADQLAEALSALERCTRELQQQIMSVRMMPVGTVFGRFPRLIRDLARELGKQIRVEISGEETELDRQVLEEIGDPLTHLIRNCVDHGIESPEERRACGKEPDGTVYLSAYYEAGKVIIRIADNGRGLDVDRIRRKGIEKGLIAENAALSPEEIQALIFHPGFSTAQTVSDLSGRGVGMDVVKRNVEALNGSVSISSEPKKFTRFTIQLPLTLAILDGLAVKIGEQIYILPLLTVVESTQIRRRDVQTIAGQAEVLIVRNEPIPLVRLGRALGCQGRFADPWEGLVVIVDHQGHKFGLLVDELIGQQQVVMKSLESNYRKVDGVLAATITGDGHVALILDVAGVVRLARGLPTITRDSAGDACQNVHSSLSSAADASCLLTT